MANDVSLNLSGEVVEPIVREKINAAVINALGDSDRLIRAAVQFALDMKVDSSGKPSNYSHSKTFIAWFCEKALRETATAALQEFVDEQRPAITAEIKRQLSLSRNKVARAFVNGLADSLDSKYKLSVDVMFKSPTS